MITGWMFAITLVAIAPVMPHVEPIPASRMYATIRIEKSTLAECEQAKTETKVQTGMAYTFGDCQFFKRPAQIP